MDVEKKVNHQEVDKAAIKQIASEIAQFLKTYNLPVWQAKEALLYAREEIDRAIFK